MGKIQDLIKKKVLAMDLTVLSRLLQRIIWKIFVPT